MLAELAPQMYSKVASVGTEDQERIGAEDESTLLSVEFVKK